MTILIKNADIHLIDLNTRVPFKYGIATLTSAPHVFIRVELEIDNRTSFGVSADHLPPKWFTKEPEKSLEEEIEDMLDVVLHALKIAPGLKAENAFDLWGQILEKQIEWGESKKYPPLLYKFGVSLVERAMIEAVCKDAGLSFSAALRQNIFGIHPEKYFPELEGMSLEKVIPENPIPRARIRQTVGLLDPINDEQIPSGEKLDDGLPQSIASLIHFYGLRNLKIKVCSDLEKDLSRLRELNRVVKELIPRGFAFTLDGNEQFHSMDKFRQFWEAVKSDEQLQEFFNHLMFVEQPFHREIAMNPDVISELKNWTSRPPMIIDESDDQLESMKQAIELGYHGTSHKNCKGIFKTIMNACLIAKEKKKNPELVRILSCEDLASVGPVSMIQDLAVAGALGIESVERNGHHYFKGLSAFPKEVQEQVFEFQGDLYHPTEEGWPALTITNGEISLESVNNAHLGVGYVIDVEQFESLEQWRLKHPEEKQ